MLAIADGQNTHTQPWRGWVGKLHPSGRDLHAHAYPVTLACTTVKSHQRTVPSERCVERIWNTCLPISRVACVACHDYAHRWFPSRMHALMSYFQTRNTLSPGIGFGHTHIQSGMLNDVKCCEHRSCEESRVNLRLSTAAKTITECTEQLHANALCSKCETSSTRDGELARFQHQNQHARIYNQVMSNTHNSPVTRAATALTWRHYPLKKLCIYTKSKRIHTRVITYASKKYTIESHTHTRAKHNFQDAHDQQYETRMQTHARTIQLCTSSPLYPTLVAWNISVVKFGYLTLSQSVTHISAYRGKIILLAFLIISRYSN